MFTSILWFLCRLLQVSCVTYTEDACSGWSLATAQRAKEKIVSSHKSRD